MIRFMFGRPGTGKTRRVVEEIRQLVSAGERRVWLIVPEQQVYSAERDILSSLPPDAGRTFSITSFSRLCDLVADRYGGRAQHTVNRAMQALLMWENLRELSGLLEVYTHTSSTDPALTRKMLEVTREMEINAIPPQKLERAAECLDATAPLRSKLRDLALICASYNGLLTETFGENPADRLLRTADQLEVHDFFAGDVVFIDSFSSFTMQEYRLIRPILTQADCITVTFGCRDRYDREPQLQSLTDAVHRLTRLSTDAGVPFEDILLSDTDADSSSELSILERELWSFELRAEDRMIPEESARGQIMLAFAPHIYDEAEAAALHIVAEAKRGVPYGEIAVVVRNTDAWKGVLDAALEKYHIPYFLSERTDLHEKPAARLLLTALRCVARRWQAEDIIALAKTGLCGVTPRELDFFSEYVDTWHLTGSRMTDKAWSMNPDGYTTDMTSRGLVILQNANRVRERIMNPLLILAQDIRSAETVTEECRALYAYLNALSVKQQLGEAAESYLAEGNAREAGELVRLWSFLTETLATVASVMEHAQPMSADELCTALSIVFEETDIGSVPQQHDCVTIGSAATLRVDNIRTMLLLGLCEGEFPQTVTDDSLLSEQDRATLSKWGIEFDTRSDRILSDELLFVWRAMTKPDERLILSYYQATPDGQARSPSSAYTRVRYLFPYLTPIPFSSKYIRDGKATRHRTPMEDAISRPTARRLLGEEIWLSQSRLQTYAHCPYSYYGSHILRLRAPVEARFDNLCAGVFLHHVMEQYLRHALDTDNRLRPMTDDESRETVDAIIEAYMRELCPDISENGRLLHLFDRLRRIALVLIESIEAELRQSDFRIAGLEWDTHGRKPEDPRPLALTLNLTEESFLSANYPKYAIDPSIDGCALPTEKPILNLTSDGPFALPITTPSEESPIRLLLGGRVDRVDFFRADDGETVYVRVIDYKSSKHDFSIKSLTADMNIQLLLYLFTLCSPENHALFADPAGHVPTRVLPAAAVYMSPDESSRDGTVRPLRTGIAVDEPLLLQAANHDPEAVYLPSCKRDKNQVLVGKGLCSRDQIADLETLLRELIHDTAVTMYSGCAGRTPSEAACRYCILRTSCAASV